MKRLIFAAMLAATCAAHAQTYVPGYVKRDGTYVQPHYRSAPDTSRMNNYGAQNSIYGANPYTGEKGSQRDELSQQPAYNQPKPWGSTQNQINGGCNGKISCF